MTSGIAASKIAAPAAPVRASTSPSVTSPSSVGGRSVGRSSWGMPEGRQPGDGSPRSGSGNGSRSRVECPDNRLQGVGRHRNVVVSDWLMSIASAVRGVTVVSFHQSCLFCLELAPLRGNLRRESPDAESGVVKLSFVEDTVADFVGGEVRVEHIV